MRERVSEIAGEHRPSEGKDSGAEADTRAGGSVAPHGSKHFYKENEERCAGFFCGGDAPDC